LGEFHFFTWLLLGTYYGSVVKEVAIMMSFGMSGLMEREMTHSPYHVLVA
jgi:hypothetical protein